MTAVPSPHTETLVSATVSTVTFSSNFVAVEVWSDGAAEMGFTANGATPVVGADGTHYLPSGEPSSVQVQAYANNGLTVVKLLSSGTPKVSARGLDYPGGRTIGGSSGGGGGSATAANQTTGNTSLASIDSHTPALGQAAMAASQPVVIASDQSTVATSANAATRPAATTMQSAAVASGNGTSLPVTGMAVALLNVVSSPSMSGGTTLNFEASVDDTTWVTIGAHNIGVNGSLATTATIDGDYRIACSGYKSVRCRISAYSAGTITVKGYAVPTASQPTAVALATSTNAIGTVTANAGTNLNTSALALDATLTGGTQVTKVGDGTNTAHILKADGTAAGQGAQLVAGGHLAVAFTTTTVQAVAATDAANYAWVSVHVTGQGGSSTVTWQCSNDNTNWNAMGLFQAAAASLGPITSITGTGIYTGPLTGRYFRLNVTGIASGTTAGVAEFFTQARMAASLGVSATQSGTWTVTQSAATTGGYSFTNITANTAGTTVKSGAGTLRSVLVNTAGASSNVLTLYDGTSTGGTKIGTVDTNSLRTIPYDLAFTTGLFAVLATGTAADLTILYK